MQPTDFDRINLDGIDAVLTDLDDTLYSFPPTHEHALHTCFAQESFGMEWPEFRKSFDLHRNKVVARLAPQGTCRTRLFVFQSLAEELGLPRPYGIAADLDILYWDSFLQKMTVDDGALAFLQRCAAQSVKVCVVTDMTTHVQVRKLRRLGIEQYVSHLVTSEEAGAEKPDRKMFQTALAKLNAPAEAAIMLGDNRAKDIDGARDCGIRTALIRLG